MECKTCRWWEPTITTHGLCRRYPPTVMEHHERDCQPVTTKDDYCGEYAEAPANPPTADA
jgi:hypothetical protein